VFDDNGFLTDEGVCRLHATGKGEIIERMLEVQGFDAASCVSVGDSEMDLSMHVEKSRFIGFNPSRASSEAAFEDAGVPVVRVKDLREILPLMGF
jgi:phosphoserine phosphatase